VWEEALTVLTRAPAVLHNCSDDDVNGDMNVRLAKAAVTNRKDSSLLFKRARAAKKILRIFCLEDFKNTNLVINYLINLILKIILVNKCTV